MIYHLALPADWDNAVRSGAYRISTRGMTLEQQGFIHASEAHQVAGVADAFYRPDDNAVVLSIDIDRLTSDLKYDDVPGTGQQFPHIYGPLNIDAVVAVVPLATWTPPPADR